MVSSFRVLRKVSLERVIKHVRGIETQIIPVVSKVIRENPGFSSYQIVNQDDVVSTVNSSVLEARDKVKAELRTIHTAAGLLGIQIARKDFKDSGLEFPDFTFIPSDEHFNLVTNDVNVMFDEALDDISSSLLDSLDNIEDTNSISLPRLRVIDSRIAINIAVRRLSARVQASTVVVETRSRSEAQLQVYREFQLQNSSLRIKKEWEATSATPCPACAALHGTIIDLDEEFDPLATTSSSFSLPRVYMNLLTPPRHVRCRCRVKLVVDFDDLAQRVLTETPPIRNYFMSADDVRSMTNIKYRSLVSFVKAAFNRVRRLIRRRR